MELSVIYHRIMRIAEIVYDHPLIYLPLIGAWLITELYFIINCDDSHGHTYVMSTGITLIFTSYAISPFAVSQTISYFGRMHKMLVLALFLYGLFLVIFGIQRKFPSWLAEFFGAPGHALIPGMMGILYVFHNVPFDRITLLLIAAPVASLALIKTYRRLKHRLHQFTQSKRGLDSAEEK